jgi:hypothetical protein
MEIVHQSVTRTGQHLKGKDTGTYDLRQNNPGRPTVLGVLPEWENDQLTLSQTDKAWQHLDDLLEECQLKANTTQSTTAVINGWINSSAPGFRKSTGQDVSQRILETLVKHNANRIGIRTISDQVSRATQQWETIVERTGMQFLNNNDRSGGTQG